MSGERVRALLTGPARALNVGLGGFAETLAQQGVEALHLDWRPAAGGDPRAVWALAQLSADVDDADAVGSRVERANAVAIERLLGARPTLVGLARARDVWPDGERRILHAGPPIAWETMCGPMRGAVLGAVQLEQWAASPEEARALVERGAVELAPCHHYGAVGPMAGIISP